MDSLSGERDTFGSVKLPLKALWGPQTGRAVDRFPASGLRADEVLIRELVSSRGFGSEEDDGRPRLIVRRARRIYPCVFSSRHVSTRPSLLKSRGSCGRYAPAQLARPGLPHTRFISRTRSLVSTKGIRRIGSSVGFPARCLRFRSTGANYVAAGFFRRTVVQELAGCLSMVQHRCCRSPDLSGSCSMPRALTTTGSHSNLT